MVTGNTSQLSGLFGVYLQVGDLDRSLSFYRDVLALEVVWNDGALAVLHGHRAPADALVIREIGKTATVRILATLLRPPMRGPSPKCRASYCAGTRPGGL